MPSSAALASRWQWRARARLPRYLDDMKRALALFALLAWAGIVAVLVVLAVNHTLEALGSFLCTGVAVAAVWVALVTRRWVRWLGLVVAVLAVAGALAILIGDGAFVTLAIYIVLLALAAGATSLALKRTGHAAGWERLPAPGRPVLIMNPWSGGGKVERFNLPTSAASGASRRSCWPAATTCANWRSTPRTRAPAHSAWPVGTDRRRSSPRWRWSAVSRTCASRRAPAITWRSISASTVTTSSAPWTPTATRDWSARSISPPSTARFSSTTSRSASTRRSSSPTSTATTRSAPRCATARPGRPRRRALRPALRGAGRRRHATAHLLMVSNGPYRLDRLFGMGTRPRLDSGVLGIVSVAIDGPGPAAEFVALEGAGQAARFRGWRDVGGDRVRRRGRQAGSGGRRRRGADPGSAAALRHASGRVARAPGPPPPGSFPLGGDALECRRGHGSARTHRIRACARRVASRACSGRAGPATRSTACRAASGLVGDVPPWPGSWW